MVTAVYIAPWPHNISSAPPRVDVVSGLVRQDSFVSGRRFREDGLLEAQKLPTGRGRKSKCSWRPAVAKQTKPINNDSRGSFTLKKTKQFRYWGPCGTLNALGAIFFYRIFMDITPLVARVFLLGFSMYLVPGFGSHGSGIPDFGMCPLSKPHKVSTTSQFRTRNGAVQCSMSPPLFFKPKLCTDGGGAERKRGILECSDFEFLYIA